MLFQSKKNWVGGHNTPLSKKKYSADEIVTLYPFFVMEIIWESGKNLYDWQCYFASVFSSKSCVGLALGLARH